jgi:hypothetical protein
VMLRGEEEDEREREKRGEKEDSSFFPRGK